MNNFRPSPFANIPPATLNLIIINAIFWLASILFPKFLNIDIIEYLGLHYWQSTEFNPIQFITYMFLHSNGSITHLFFNMFGVYMFGRMLEHVWGTKKFLFYYIITGVGAGIIQQITWTIDLYPLISAFDEALNVGNGAPLVPFADQFRGGDIALARPDNILMLRSEYFNMAVNKYVTIGASGALFGILLAFGWLFPQAEMMLIFLPIPIPARIFVALYAIIELLMGVANFSFDSVAHFAHLGGMIFGAIVLYIWKRQHKLYN